MSVSYLEHESNNLLINTIMLAYSVLGLMCEVLLKFNMHLCFSVVGIHHSRSLAALPHLSACYNRKLRFSSLLSLSLSLYTLKMHV